MRTLSTVNEDVPREPYRVLVHETELMPGYELKGYNKLADGLEDEAILESMRRAET